MESGDGARTTPSAPVSITGSGVTGAVEYVKPDSEGKSADVRSIAGVTGIGSTSTRCGRSGRVTVWGATYSDRT